MQKVTFNSSKQSVAEDLKNHWSEFKIAFRNLNNAFEKLNIDIKRFITDFTKLVPLLYYVYYNSTTYEQDHLHPESRFSEPKSFSVSAEEWQKWYINRNRLPNLQLLSDPENKSKSHSQQ